MPKTSVLGRPDYKANLSKEWFNMSEPFKFTSGTGQLLPVYFDFLSPGDKIKYQCSLFSRTEELASPAVVDIDEYVDLFFVPLKKLYSPVNQLLAAVDDFESTQFQYIASENTKRFMPGLDLQAFWDVDNYQEFFDLHPADNAYGSYGQNMDYFYHGACRLFDHLGIDITQIANWGYPDFSLHSPQAYSPVISLMYLAAYQAIYYDYYRLSNWESNFIFAYNFDDLAPSYNIGYNRRSTSFDTSKYYKMFELHYRAYDRDYFKAVEPSPLIQSTGVLIGSYGNSANNAALPYDPNAVFPTTQQKFDINGNSTSGFNFASLGVGYANQYATLLSIRTSLAWEKMLRIQAMNGQHYDDQVLAHYGFKVPKGIGNEVYYLGSHHQQIHIGEVISTAATENAPLGQLAGKGYGGSLRDLSKPIEFTAPCHGILMAIYSAVPELSYQTGLNKLHTALTRYDLPLPELDNLGMQPMYQYEYDAMTRGAIAPTSRVGWQWRYMQYKTKYPRNTLAFFKKRGSGSDFVSGPRFSWTLAVRANETGGFTGLDSLLCPPNALDQIMLQSYYYATRNDFAEADLIDFPTFAYAGDPLTHFFKSTCYKSSFMSTFGLENLGKL